MLHALHDFSMVANMIMLVQFGVCYLNLRIADISYVSDTFIYALEWIGG